MREQARSLVWLSHILIRHSDSSPQVACSVFRWQLESPAPSRDRATARALAERVARAAAAKEEPFPVLARRYSEDETSRELGGDLGGLRAHECFRSPEILDALAAIQPGETSRVVETAYGFHIVHRRSPPPPEQVGGMHLVIGHDNVRWLTLMGHPTPPRSRAEALTLARQIAREARHDPSRFSELVALHSEHPDRIAKGALGTWSVHEATPLPRSIAALRLVAIGEIAGPIDTPAGIEILLRTPPKPNRAFGMEAVSVRYQPDDPETKRQAWDKAVEITELLQHHPEDFDNFRRKHHSLELHRVVKGRAELNLAERLQALEVGQIAAKPVEQYLAIVIPRRVAAPLRDAAHKAKLDLPTPAAVSFEAVAELLPPPIIVRALSSSVLSLKSPPGVEAGPFAQGLAVARTRLESLEPGDLAPNPAAGLDALFEELQTSAGAKVSMVIRKNFLARVEAGILREPNTVPL